MAFSSPRKALVCLSVALLPAALHRTAAAGPTDPAPTYNLSRTIVAALASSAEVQVAARNVQIDRKEADVEFARMRPHVQFQGSASKYDAKTQVDMPGVGSLTMLQDHNEILSLGLSQAIDLFGQIRNAASQRKLQSLADKFALVSVQNRRVLTAKAVYYNLLRAEHQVQVAESALTTAEQQRAIAEKLHDNQVGQKIDVLRAATQVAAAQQEATRARNIRDVARNSFNDLIGRPLDAVVEVEDVAGVAVGVDVGAGSVGTSAPEIRSPFAPALDKVESIDVAKSLGDADAHRPEIMQARVMTRVAETGIKLARAGMQPTVGITLSTDYFPTPSFQYVRQATSEIVFGVTIPLYDGGATRARVQEARLQSENASTVLDRTRKDVAMDVRRTYLNLVTAARQVGTANTALQQAVAARRLAQSRYENQVGLYLEITDSQSALVQAENNQVNAVYDYLIARAQYENALGTPTTE